MKKGLHLLSSISESALRYLKGNLKFLNFYGIKTIELENKIDEDLSRELQLINDKDLNLLIE